MKSNLKTIIKRTVIGWLYSVVQHWYDNVTSSYFKCGIGDILLCRDMISNNQLLLTSRLMDVEAYIEKSDITFPYQNTISRMAYGSKHREEEGNKKFEALIDSYKRDGYHTDSFITCDRDMNLLDGNHRMGLHIYEKIVCVNVRLLKRKISFHYGIDWYYSIRLPTDFLNNILRRYKEIQTWLVDNGLTFCAYFSDDKSKLISDMYGLCRVMRVIIVKDYPGALILFAMSEPKYKVIDGELISLRATKINQILEKRKTAGESFIISKNCLEGHHLYKKYTETNKNSLSSKGKVDY